ncbi:class I SAM-dependent methyltransferase [Roseococcus sp. DSY-14]|uniref:class I SAM-dependent methyltransferase n=1 Tax=Roseococcus sp. DSY-14 TaxID=3369650 RepID=UPI00387B3063
MDGFPAAPPRPARQGGAWLFLRRWARDPLQMGSIIPSSPALGRRVARASDWSGDGCVVELGAGTGAISRALLGAGLPPERLCLVEIVPEMAEHLRAALPGVEVVTGDAFALPDILPRRLRGRVRTVICGIPLVLLPLERQRAFAAAAEGAAPGRGFLLYTYCATSPLRHRALGLAARREAFTLLNFPPASVWRYSPGG